MKTRNADVAGFSLLEALIALALTAMVLGALGAVSRNWLPNWMHGFTQLQNQERFAIALRRLASDLSASEFVPARPDSRDPLFEGHSDSITFVRSTFGPNSAAGLEVVKFVQVREGSSYLLVRSSAPYDLVAGGEYAQKNQELTTVLRSAGRLSFAYGDRDRIWRDTWEQQPRLPARIRIIGQGPKETITTAVSVHSEIPIECLSSNSLEACFSFQNARQDRQQ